MMLKFLLPILFLFTFFEVPAQPVFDYNDPSKTFLLGDYMEFIEDPSGKMQLEDVRKSTLFKPTGQTVPNFTLSSSAFWIRFYLKNNTPEKKHIT